MHGAADGGEVQGQTHPRTALRDHRPADISAVRTALDADRRDPAAAPEHFAGVHRSIGSRARTRCGSRSRPASSLRCSRSGTARPPRSGGPSRRTCSTVEGPRHAPARMPHASSRRLTPGTQRTGRARRAGPAVSRDKGQRTSQKDFKGRGTRKQCQGNQAWRGAASACALAVLAGLVPCPLTPL